MAATVKRERVASLDRSESQSDPQMMDTRANVKSAEWELSQIERARNDPAAFAPLYEAYVDLVWKYAFSRLGDRDRAADATSQTFIKAIVALPEFRPQRRGRKTSFQSWLMKIAHNVMMDDFRRTRPTTDLESPAAEPWLVDQRRSPEEAAIASEERFRVEWALTQLTPVQRKIVELRIAGASGAEIANLLEMSISAVRTAHHRAYARLRDLLGDEKTNQGTSV